jgi:hypothetical protein
MEGTLDVSVDLLNRQLAHAFAAAQWQVQRLSDEEYFWEPRPGCWSVRPRGRALSAQPSGRGEWVIDGEWPSSGPPPVTTIAWRVVHLAAWTAVYCDWTFATATRSYDDFEVPGHASAAVKVLHDTQEEFASAVAPLTNEDLLELRPAHWGAEYPVGALVWQIVVEHLHHSAEIGVLRDLHRGTGRVDSWPLPVAVL